MSLFGDAGWGDRFTAHAKIDFIDLYDRNPTSTGQKVDVDEAWVRLGAEPLPATLAPRSGVYLKIGKLAKFERQNDRHLESYGVVSTAFNRFEETGGELGAHLGRHFYLKLRAAAGNPVFLRDPNALAGDNGTPALLRPHPDPPLKSGIAILYNAHYANLDLDGKLETGAGIGWRLADEEGQNGLDLLVWANRRKLADTEMLHGSFYGGDLDILNGPFNDFHFRSRTTTSARPAATSGSTSAASPSSASTWIRTWPACPARVSKARSPGGSTCRSSGPWAAASSSPSSRRPCATRSSTTISRARR